MKCSPNHERICLYKKMLSTKFTNMHEQNQVVEQTETDIQQIIYLFVLLRAFSVLWIKDF